MNRETEPGQELKKLRERMSALGTAILRINATLDVTRVLQEIVDSACALSRARYGVITTIDGDGQVQEFISSGFTAAEHAEFAAWPDGLRLWEHFRDLPTTIRLTDLPAFVRSLGYSPDLMRSKTFQGTPLRHRGAQVGNLFLAEKEGAPEFTAEDEGGTGSVRFAGGDGDRQRPHPPRRAARPGRPGSAGRDLPGRRGGA